MNSRTTYKSLVFASVALLMAGCATVTKNPSTAKVDDTFKKGSSSPEVPNDIKGILVAGGLDAKNPSAPTTETKVAEIKPSKASIVDDVEKLIAKLDPDFGTAPATASTVASSEQPVLMAALEPKTQAAPPVARPQPVVTKKDITPSEAPKAVALTSTTVKLTDSEHALETLTLESKPQITSVTFSYPEIGVAALEPSVVKAEEETKPPTVAKPKKSKRVVAPSPIETASIKKPRRF